MKLHQKNLSASARHTHTYVLAGGNGNMSGGINKNLMKARIRSMRPAFACVRHFYRTFWQNIFRAL